MGLFEKAGRGRTTVVGAVPLTLEERLKARIVEGEKPGLEPLLDEALRIHDPLTIINEILLDGMKRVGELFGSGQMQLPFVLQSAEVMKTAVGYLDRFMSKSDGQSRGKIVLATVKGDVHDIGKNLVDIILSNNGYSVINLGIKAAHPQHRRGGAHAPGGRHRDERPAGEVDAGDEGESGGAERPGAGPVPGDPGWGRAHPRLRGGGPARDLQGRSLLCRRCFRWTPPDGRDHGA